MIGMYDSNLPEVQQSSLGPFTVSENFYQLDDLSALVGGQAIQANGPLRPPAQPCSLDTTLDLARVFLSVFGHGHAETLHPFGYHMQGSRVS
jgi:hypothetical protein